MTSSDPAFDCLFNTISGFLLPFFLAGAGGDPQAAQAAIAQLISSYNPTTTQELDLAGRIIGFSIVALDNLRLSMTGDLSNTKILQYRSNAVSLSRASEQARQILQAHQEQREITTSVPRPSVAPAHSVVPPSGPSSAVTTSVPPLADPAGQSVGDVVAAPTPPVFDIEAMKRDARTMMAAFARAGGASGSVIRTAPDPAAAIVAATRAAVAASRQPPVSTGRHRSA
jgi:hypothetical protein